MISRPGTAAIDMLSYLEEPKSADTKFGVWDIAAEWVYLILLLMVHLLGLFLIFAWRESSWTLDAR